MSAAVEAGGLLGNPACRSRRLWSLWDMLELRSADFIRATQGLAALRGSLAPLQERFRERDPIGQAALDSVRPELVMLRDVLQHLEAQTTFSSIERFLRLLDEGGKSFPFGALCFWLGNIAVTLREEFGSQKFLALTSAEAQFYLVSAPPFGPQVEAKFPASVSEDISEASKCIACARYTASAFHLMRVLEAGTARFANILGVHPIDSRGKDKNWQNFLNEANSVIKNLPDKEQRTKDLAGISANLYNVKLAWRNECMHPKQTYTEEEAIELFGASKAFMRELASVL